MKLLKCRIYSFGKLNGFNYDFNGGLNVINENNGWGKSTFAYFIKSMFYGLNDSKKTVEENERKRFTPWNTARKFGGSLTFSFREGEWTVERLFGAKRSEDEVRVTDERTGKPVSGDFTEEGLGKRVFGIDGQGFVSTVFLSQDKTEADGQVITAKYSEIYGGNANEDPAAALSAVEERLKKLRSRGDKGEIAELKRKLWTASEKAEDLKSNAERIDIVRADLKEAEKRRSLAEKSLSDLSEKAKRAAKAEVAAENRRRVARLQAELTDLSAKKERIAAAFNGEIPAENALKACSDCIKDLSVLKQKHDILSADVKDLNEKINYMRTAENPRKKILKGVFIALGAILAVAGIILALALDIIFGISVAIAGATSGALAAVLLREKKHRSDPEMVRLSEKKTVDLEKTALEIKETEDGLNAFLNGYVTETFLPFENRLNCLIAARNEYIKTEERIAQIKGEITDADVSAEEVADFSAESLERETEAVRREYGAFSEKIAFLKGELAKLEETADEIPDAEALKKDIKEELSAKEREYFILTVVKEKMQTAAENIKTRYRKPLQDGLNGYLSVITDNCVAEIDTDLNVTVSEKDGKRETDYYSRGYKTAFGVCKRLALAKALFTSENPFIVLDDPFSDFDDERVEKALNAVEKLAEETQIIYLVCSESRTVKSR